MRTYTSLLLTLLLAGCIGGSTGLDEPTTTLAPTTTVLAGLPVELTDCSSPPDGFEVLCETYRLLQEHYVDPLDDRALAEGATRGIEEFDPDETTSSPPSEVACATPTTAFREMCELFAERQAEDPAPAADLVEAALRGMLQYGLGDPNTIYLSPEALEHVTAQQSGEVSGIGALVRAEDLTSEEGATCPIMSDTCLLVIISTLEDSPAEAEGVEPGDGVVTVDGRDVEGWTVDEVVAAVRGPAGTRVTLGLLRRGVVIELTITRAEVVVPVVTTELIEPDIGYISFSDFTSNSGGQVRDALTEILDLGATKIIFDMQNNRGGTLRAAIQVASQFLADGPVLRTESPGDDTEYRVEPGGVATDPALEVVVVVNRASASAAEVVAAVLQETGRATIVGEPTFGKNTVQQRFDLEDGGAVNLTIARWVTPEGPRLRRGGRPARPGARGTGRRRTRLLRAASGRVPARLNSPGSSPGGH